MLLIDNINILKKMYSSTWNKLKSLEDSIDMNFINLEETRKGYKTLSIERDEKKTYIHSKYNPLREAESIIEEYKEVKDNTTVIFYGTGLGYHIELFLERYPNVNYYIYEPVSELLYQYLCNKSIKNLPSKNLKNIVLGSDIEETVMFLNNVIDKSYGDVLLVEFPIHKQIFSAEYEIFLDLFKKILKDKRSSIHTDYAFQERWIINSMKNFGDVLSTPNILIEKKGEFKDKPVILVAAGPSLNEEIENIRYIKENGLAYIFSVGSAINTLIYHDIYPDVVTSYDPKVGNQKVIEVIKKKNIKEIPVIFGSSIGYETIENYPGEKYHIITSQDTVSNYYLKDGDGNDVNIVQDAPSIAVVTIQLLYELGFSHIILVGQNLAYRGKERHSEGVQYSKEVTEEEIEKGIWVKDVYGNELLTNDGFNAMRLQMEYYIKKLPNIKVINTTKGGANIEGTRFIDLKDVIDKRLKNSAVEENWLGRNKTHYDKDYLKLRLKNMEGAYNRTLKINKEYCDILDRIDKLINNRNFGQVENMYVRLDKELRKIENNDYYKTFILPMNRVQYKILADSIDRLNDERDPYEKGKRIVESFRNFMDICTKDMEMIKPIYDEMKKNINNYIEK